VFVDLSAAYDTVRHHGLACKLLRLLPDGHMFHMIMEMVGNRNFTFCIENDKRSRLQRLENGIPQGSVLAPLTFNTCISELHADGDWQGVEGGLSKDMATIG